MTDPTPRGINAHTYKRLKTSVLAYLPFELGDGWTLPQMEDAFCASRIELVITLTAMRREGYLAKDARGTWRRIRVTFRGAEESKR